MKKIEIDDELYQYIASRTQAIGESASDILRRLLRLPASPEPFALVQDNMTGKSSQPLTPKQKEKALREQVSGALDKLLKSEEFAKTNKNVRRFLLILSTLYQQNSTGFAQAVENMHGSERLYFALDEKTILATGSGVKAKRVPESPYWVITNNNTARKGIILTKVMTNMGLARTSIEKVQKLFA